MMKLIIIISKLTAICLIDWLEMWILICIHDQNLECTTNYPNQLMWLLGNIESLNLEKMKNLFK